MAYELCNISCNYKITFLNFNECEHNGLRCPLVHYCRTKEYTTDAWRRTCQCIVIDCNMWLFFFIGCKGIFFIYKFEQFFINFRLFFYLCFAIISIYGVITTFK